MKKTLKRSIVLFILIAASVTLHAQNWLLGGNNAASGLTASNAKLGSKAGTNINLNFITNGTNRMTFKWNGNIGIGTTAPIANYGVHILGGVGTAQYSGLYVQRADAGGGNQDNALGINFSSSLFTSVGIGGGSCGFILYPSVSTPAADMAFSTNNVAPQMIIKNSGKVGIGIANPLEKLHVDNGAIRVTGNNGNGGPMILFGGVSTSPSAEWGIEYTNNLTAHNGLNFWKPFGSSNSGNNYLFLNDNGNIGMGTDNPTENLVVSELAGNVAGTQNFLLVETAVNPFVPSDQGVIIRKDDGQKRGFKLFQDGSDDANSVFKIASFSASNDIDRLTIKRDNGNVGIGTNAPTAKLSVNGTADNTTGAWGVFSDSRVKKVIADFTDGLNVIRQIRTIKFNYNENAPFKAEGGQIGVVAQELEKVAPYMVSKKTMGAMKDLREVNNQAYPFLLINAVKELAIENEELKAQLSAMNSRLDVLENKTTSSSQNTSQAFNNNNSDAHLYQIAPNPFSQKATISIKLPSAISSAQLLIINEAGKTIKTYSLSTGSTQQNIYANNLTAGVYHYSLFVNGKMIDSKQMVITK